MENINNNLQENNQYGILTKSLAGVCHHCGICAYAHKKQGSTFEKVMRWHRTWCPAWAAHAKVYGVKKLSI